MNGPIRALAARGFRRRAVWLLLSGAALSTTGASAQIVAPAGRTLFNQGVLVRSLVRLDTFEESRSGEELTRFRSINAVVWGARPHLSLGLVAPVVHTEVSAPAGAGPNVSRTGTGDATVFGRYDVVRRTVPGGYTRLAPEVAVTLPTGGAFSSGSTDVSTALVFSNVRDPDWWIADVQLTSHGTGDNERRAGELWRFDLAYLRRCCHGRE